MSNIYNFVKGKYNIDQLLKCPFLFNYLASNTLSDVQKHASENKQLTDKNSSGIKIISSVERIH